MSEEVKELQQTVVCSSGLLGVCSFGTSHRGGGREREQDPHFMEKIVTLPCCHSTHTQPHVHTHACTHTHTQPHAHTNTTPNIHPPNHTHTHTHTHTHYQHASINYPSIFPPPHPHPKKWIVFNQQEDDLYIKYRILTDLHTS